MPFCQARSEHIFRTIILLCIYFLTIYRSLFCIVVVNVLCLPLNLTNDFAVLYFLLIFLSTYYLPPLHYLSSSKIFCFLTSICTLDKGAIETFLNNQRRWIKIAETVFLIVICRQLGDIAIKNSVSNHF